MWQLRILQICTWLESEGYIGWCRDSQYFYIIMDSTFQYQEGKMSSFKLTEGLFRVGISIVVIVGCLREHSAAYEP